MILFDTSFLFAFFREQDVHHRETLKLMKKLNDKSLLLPVEVFEELMTVITRKVSSNEAAKVGKLLLSPDSPVELLKSADNIFQNAWVNFQALSPHSFSFVDCVLIALAKELACPVLTFDKDLETVLNSRM